MIKIDTFIYKSELLKFIGIILTGVHTLPQMDHYRNEVTLVRNIFCSITKYLHLADNNNLNVSDFFFILKVPYFF